MTGTPTPKELQEFNDDVQDICDQLIDYCNDMVIGNPNRKIAVAKALVITAAHYGVFAICDYKGMKLDVGRMHVLIELFAETMTSSSFSLATGSGVLVVKETQWPITKPSEPSPKGKSKPPRASS